MGILRTIDFEVNHPKYLGYPTLINRPWGRNLKASISLEKDRIKLKQHGKKAIIPLDPLE